VPSYPGWSFNRANYPVGRAGPEWKYLDTGTNGTTLTSAGFMYLLNGLVLGSTATQRIGTIVNIMTLDFRLVQTSLSGTPTTVVGQYRVLIFYDKQANQNTPSWGPNDLLETSNYITSPRGMNQRRRYKILYDKVMDVNSLTSGGSGSTNIHHFIRFRRPLAVQYNGGTAGTVGDIVTNSLWVGLVATASAAGGPLISFNARIRYVDC